MSGTTSQYAPPDHSSPSPRTAGLSTNTLSRLYVSTAASMTRSTAVDDSKLSSLSSVSPTSSVRNLTMRSLSSHDSSSDSGDRSHMSSVAPRYQRVTPSPPKTALKPSRTTTTKVSFNDSQTEELQQIKHSVERLRAQRTHVEQLRQHNARLESLVSERTKDAEKLQLQVASLKGVEQENVGLLRSFQLLEERIRTLEATCNERKDDLRLANERLAAMEKARDMLQLQVDELSVERDHYKMQLSTLQTAHNKKIEQIHNSHEKALAASRRAQVEWQSKLQTLQQSQNNVEKKFQDEMMQLQKENQKLVRESRETEQHVQQLLATTVRQTTIIEDCDRALSAAKSRHEGAKTSYRDQLQLNAQLQSQIKQLEMKLATCEQGFLSDRNQMEKKVFELESKVQKLKDKHEIYVVALNEKETHCEKIQQELLVRDRARFHVEEVAKDLRNKEKTLQSELSTLKVTLTDMTDERNILQDELRTAHEQLEKERKDRSRWATARLKLLAEFCDEESKLNSALHQYSTLHMHHEDTDSVDLEELELMAGSGSQEEDDVGSVLLTAGMKMDALEHHLHGSRVNTSRRRRSPKDVSSIVFG